jgi:hypothetical protein
MERALEYAVMWDKKALLRKRTNMRINTFFGQLTREEEKELAEICEAIKYQGKIEEREIEEELIRELAEETGVERNNYFDDDPIED